MGNPLDGTALIERHAGQDHQEVFFMKKGLLFGTSLLLGFAALASCGNNGSSPDVVRIGLECAYVPFNWSVKEESSFTDQLNGT